LNYGGINLLDLIGTPGMILLMGFLSKGSTLEETNFLITI